jgi:hypothetical protein
MGRPLPPTVGWSGPGPGGHLLALIVLINPGLVGLAKVRGEQSAEIVIGLRPAGNGPSLTPVRGTEDELVLPVDTRIRFDVSAIDVLHSLWVPAFRT